ncbi:hypothetical protein BEH94_01090 [Candidatus Altiarchaeales archaeon WOR_SM1_SCG]|nr:hypothetical protein BEH94_01090 [Candidatus Altiarchaeales archaeon WOR_SM1_SCG]
MDLNGSEMQEEAMKSGGIRKLERGCLYQDTRSSDMTWLKSSVRRWVLMRVNFAASQKLKDNKII